MILHVAKRIGGFLLTLLALVGLSLFQTSKMDELRKAEASPSWPSVPGRILSARVGGEVRGKVPRMYYFPVVTYAYSVRGVEYVGDRVRFGSSGKLSSSDVRDVEFDIRFKRAPGTPVTVHFNPTDPAESVLITGKESTDTTGFVLLAIATLVLLVATIGSFVMIFCHKGDKA